MPSTRTKSRAARLSASRRNSPSRPAKACLVEALKEAPQDLRLQDEIKQNLQAIQKDADLVANHELGETAKAALEALAAGEVPDAAVDAALSGLKPQMPEAPQPSAETLQLAESSHEEIDAELLAIFLEEAGEVLATLGAQREILLADPHHVDALTTIRRSAHTLKGSGRMVGLTDLGETAWEMEQTLNLWLRQDQSVTPELMGMISDAHRLFSVWVEHLESGDGLAPETAAFVALAGRLRGVEPPPVVVAPAAPEAASAVLESAPSVQQVELRAPATPLEQFPSFSTGPCSMNLLTAARLGFLPIKPLLRSTGDRERTSAGCPCWTNAPPPPEPLPPTVTARRRLLHFPEEAAVTCKVLDVPRLDAIAAAATSG